MIKRVSVLFSLIVIILVVFTAESGATPGPKPDDIFSPAPGDAGQVLGAENQAEAYVPGELIVKFKPGNNRASVDEVASRHGGRAERELALPDHWLISLPLDKNLPEVADALRHNPNVEFAEPNAYRYAYFAPNDPYYSYQWHFPQIQMPQAWDLSNGNGVIVAVVDTGVAYENYGIYAQAPDLANTTFVAGWDFVNNDAHPNDDNSHGTHVAGTIAQSTNNSVGVAGIAYAAKIMPVKVLDSKGSGSDITVGDGIKWAVDHGAKVINLSLGGSLPSTYMESIVNYAYSNGVVVVAAAGNSNGPIGYPAAYTNAIAVGAVRYDQTRAYYSSYGPQLDLVAPGGDITVDQNSDGYGDGVLQQTFASGNPASFAYYFFQGTSMASPHVAGVAALLIASGVATTPDQVRQALQSTAKDLGAPGWDQYYGYGLVQAYDALRYQSGPTTTPTATRTATSTPTSVSTSTATATSTSTPTPTNTSIPIDTATPTATATSTATSTNTSVPVDTATPTATATTVPPGTNLALAKPVTVSSIYAPGFEGPNAVDGDTTTMWASVPRNNQWISVDLGARYNISQVVLNWAASYGKNYQIQVSDDGVNWNTVYSRKGGTGGIETLTITGTGRYVRMYGQVSGPMKGFSIWEFEVYGN